MLCSLVSYALFVILHAAPHSHSIKFDYTEDCIPLQQEVPKTVQPTVSM